jgi:hypothetical protein
MGPQGCAMQMRIFALDSAQQQPSRGSQVPHMRRALNGYSHATRCMREKEPRVLAAPRQLTAQAQPQQSACPAPPWPPPSLLHCLAAQQPAPRPVAACGASTALSECP